MPSGAEPACLRGCGPPGLSRPSRPAGRPLPPAWYARPATDVAPDLLNKIVAVGTPGPGSPAALEWRWARIVEVEAYQQEDAASHAFRGPTRRNATMFGPGGLLYVYFTYGMHWCANVVTGPAGRGDAVLLRAAEPLGGIEAMGAGRSALADRDLGRGPGRLGRALDLGAADDGRPLTGPLRWWRPGGGDGRRVLILDDGVPPPDAPARGPRVGITRDVALPWRFWIPGSPAVSGRPNRRAGPGFPG